MSPEATPLNTFALESSEKELARHLLGGKSVRSPNGANRVRQLVHAALLVPANQRMCRQYGVSPRELSIAYTEIVAAMERPFVSGRKTLLAPTSLFTNSGELEEFLKEIHRATHGQTALQRHLAIVGCAKRRALILADDPSEKVVEVTRSKLLKASIEAKLPTMLICAIIVVAWVLIAVYLF